MYIFSTKINFMQFRLKYVITSVVFLSMVSCSKALLTTTHHNTKVQLQLGEIGEDENFALEKNYRHTAVPNYDEPVKINVRQNTFTKKTYKTFTKANTKKLAVTYIDSLEKKPNYLTLSISDRVTVLNAINGKTNTNVKTYLSNKFNSHIVSDIGIVFSEQQQNAILQADEVFFKTHGLKAYALYLYKNGNLVTTIPFSEGVVFNYKTLNFCWKQIKYATWNIVDILEDNERCSKGTYKYPKMEKTVDEYLKF